MPIAALLLPILAAAVQAADAPSSRIVVTGHAWAPFISPMGEPFRARSVADDTLARWFHQADRNGDGALMADEMVADADRFFAKLDGNRDGEIDPDELIHYEWEVAPDIQLMSKTRRAPGEAAAKSPKRSREYSLEGAARYALLNIPEPVAAADSDFDRGISAGEFRQAAVGRFQLLDTARAGKLTLDQLQLVRTAALEANRKTKRRKDAIDSRVGNPLPPGAD